VEVFPVTENDNVNDPVNANVTVAGL